MSGRGTAGRLLRDPRVVAAALAVALRAAVALQAHSRGADVPQLDGDYYLGWAADIATGDVLGRGGTIHGEAWLFNPLYAYVLAPLTAAFGSSAALVVAFQTLLAGATAALSASAARRFAGTAASWIAGLAVAFSAALVHLDGKVAVSGLAAFLVAGAVWSLSPEPEGAPPRRGHGPVSSGVWLGLSLLARPVTLPAVACAAWLEARRSPARLRAIALVLAPVAVCAGLSFARNVGVAGEPVVFTAANGLNLHLGNNAEARRAQAMATNEFRFAPTKMHDDALYRVAFELRREPTRAEISSWFAGRALHELADAPAESLAWYATKLRWFAGPQELGSSDDLTSDRERVPLLWLAFVPTWTLVALAAAGLVVARRRADVLLGPGAIVASHALACVLVYPLSHYRSPCIPALAVMSGVAVADALACWRDGRRGRVVTACTVGVAVAIAGTLPPQVRVYPEARLADDATAALDRGELETADEFAKRSLAASADDVFALAVRLIVATRQNRFEDARAHAEHLTRLRPWDPDARFDVAWNDWRLGRTPDALREADEVVELYPWSGKVHAGRGGIRLATGDLRGGRQDLEFAIERGFQPPAWAKQRAGL